MSTQENTHEPCIEDCSDDEEYYYNNNNNECSAANNNNGDMEDKNNNNTSSSNNTRTSRSTYSSFHHKLNDRPLNITVTAKVLFGSVSAISALNAERKKKPS